MSGPHGPLDRARASATVPVVALALLAGCARTGDVSSGGDHVVGSAGPERTVAETAPADGEWSAGRPATITRSTCVDTGDCPLGVMFDDTFVEITCIPVGLEAITGDVIATGARSGVPFREARAIAEVPTRLLVALPNEQDLCHDDAPWVAGIVTDPDRSLEDELTLSISACTVLDRPYRNDQDCDHGGPAQRRTFSDDTLTVELGWFPDVVSRIDRDLAAGSGPAFRLDPAAVVAEFERWEFPDCFEEHERLEVCRIGHAEVPADPSGTVTVSGEIQTRYPDIGYETRPLEWTLEQLGDGPGWWVTTKTHGAVDRTDEADADRLWERCCPDVVTEVHARP